MPDMDSIALLKTLLLRAEADRDSAITVLRQAEALQAQAQAQADQLHAYRQDYDQRWTLRFRQAGTRELLDCKHAFGDRLEQAITGQVANASSLVNRVTLARNALLAREQRVSAVRKLIERREQQLQSLASRQEQRASDEAAQRQHQRSTVQTP